MRLEKWEYRIVYNPEDRKFRLCEFFPDLGTDGTRGKHCLADHAPSDSLRELISDTNAQRAAAMRPVLRYRGDGRYAEMSPEELRKIRGEP